MPNLVEKICQSCGFKFKVLFKKRNQKFCNHSCACKYVNGTEKMKTYNELRIKNAMSLEDICKKRKEYEKKKYLQDKQNPKWIEYYAKRSTQPSTIYTMLCNRAINKNNRVVSFTRVEFVNWYNSQPKICVYCGLPQEHIRFSTEINNRNGRRLQIDRKNSNRDYHLDNIVLSCGVCNIVKNNILDFDEMKEIGEKYIKPKWQAKLKSFQEV